MNFEPPRRASDRGFTLVEAIVCIGLMGILSTVIASALVVTFKTSPAVANRADTAVNIQGLVTWLPQDVDSAAPGSFDTDPDATSGCPGTDPGSINILKLSWREQVTSTIDFAASYRFVSLPAPAEGGVIYRVYCRIGTAPTVLKVSGTLPPWVVGAEPVKVLLSDSVDDPANLNDTARVIVTPLVGKPIVIYATTKNPAEVLSTPPAPPPPPPPPPTPGNTAPSAVDSVVNVVVETDVTVTADAFDIDGDPLTLQILVIPAGWTVTPTTGLSMTVRAPLSAAGSSGLISYEVTDTSGAKAAAMITVGATGAGGNQSPSANPSSGSTTAGAPVTVALQSSDPEGGALTAAVSGVPTGWTATVAGTNVTVTPPNTAPAGTTTLNYTVTDPVGATAASSITITVTAPPPCVVSGPVLSQSSMSVKKNNPDALDKAVTVTITIVSGYCVGLSLRYDTGAPNSQYVRPFGDSGTTRSVVLPNHPSPELWAVGPHTLEVRDGTSTTIASTNLTVTP